MRGDSSDEDILAAVATASAEDVLETLDAGLDSEVEERGRSFSGGQRRRWCWCGPWPPIRTCSCSSRPTSAVDAHTEARIAERLTEHRAGRTTVVTTASPLLLDRADQVALMQRGQVVAVGRHRDLMEDERYRRIVARGEEDR